MLPQKSLIAELYPFALPKMLYVVFVAATCVTSTLRVSNPAGAVDTCLSNTKLVHVVLCKSVLIFS